METKRIVDERIYIRIPVSTETYKVDIKWEDFLKAKNINPTDVVNGFVWKEENITTFGYDTEEPEPHQVPYILITRRRPENDDEYSARMKEKAQFDAATETRERLEYLRLKAKYE
jgi:hypothetical protein